MIYIEHYLYLFKQHNRPWSDMEKGIFIMIMAFTVAMCFIAVLRKKINILKAIDNLSGNMLLLFCMQQRFLQGSRWKAGSLDVYWHRIGNCLQGVQSERDQVTLNVILFLPFGILWDIIREKQKQFEGMCRYRRHYFTFSGNYAVYFCKRSL